MNEAQTFFSQPGVGFFTMLLIGAIAGWIAEAGHLVQPWHPDQHPCRYRGIVVGAVLRKSRKCRCFGFWRTLISAAIGAVILLFAWRMTAKAAGKLRECSKPGRQVRRQQPQRMLRLYNDFVNI